jgi:hypothetical protein
MPGTNGVPAPIDRIVMDVDGDGRISLADVSSWTTALFLLPGDGLLWATATYAPPVARLFDIGPADYGGLLSGVLSAFAWLAALLGGVIVYERVTALDRRLTRATVELYATAALRLRIARALLLQRWRAWSAPRARTSPVEVRTDIDLSPLQLRVLQLHAELSPGYVLPVSDVARALGARVRPMENLLSGLKGLGLLVRASCGADGESGYALSTGGRALLDFHERARTPAPASRPQSRPR